MSCKRSRCIVVSLDDDNDAIDDDTNILPVVIALFLPFLLFLVVAEVGTKAVVVIATAEGTKAECCALLFGDLKNGGSVHISVDVKELKLEYVSKAEEVVEKT